MPTVYVDLPVPTRNTAAIEAETAAELRARLAAGEDPAQLYILATVGVHISGAHQVIRGPIEPEPLGDVYRACFWRADAPSPGGWPVRLRICTKRTLPRWARRIVRSRAYARVVKEVASWRK